ncbi:APC family permease [Actinomycetospora lutea]|uniref:APC family permease n=1 Tax=Actinomycetospora lutea TaxID=663604 RepID=UPI002366F7D7|nr:APC family permease [Actinomycetospora lutea]MDD7941575.1 APC family permease [Actinomycetospora lutea]
MAETGAGEQTAPDTKLARNVGAVLLFFFIVGDTLGAGIYTLVGTMAEDVGGVLWLPLVIALVVALLTAGTYAEMISKYPHAGGAARYAERAYRTPFLTFIVGFFMLSSGIVTAALLANAFSGDYFTTLVALPADVLGSGGGDASRILTPSPDQPLLTGAFAASVVAFFSFLGFEAAANMAEEVKQPSRAYPRALFGAVGTAGLVYLLIALGSAIVVDPNVMAQSTGPLLEVITASGLPIPGWVFSLIALVAIANGALLFVGTISTLADTTVLLLLFVLISTNVSCLVLKKDRVPHDHFRVPAVVPVLAIVASIVLLTQQSVEIWLLGAGFVVVGTILFLVALLGRRRETAAA